MSSLNANLYLYQLRITLCYMSRYCYNNLFHRITNNTCVLNCLVILYVFYLVVQNRITAFWFKDKELAMAFGFTLTFSRLGSVLNFLVTQHFRQSYGLHWTLWGGIYFVSFICCNTNVHVCFSQIVTHFNYQTLSDLDP